MNLVAKLPWWVGIALAIFSYLVLHGLAAPRKVGPIATPTQAAAVVLPTAVAAIASIAQFIVPVLCLFGALGSFVRKKKRESLADAVATSTSADALNGMSWHQFEILVGESFRRQGFSVEEKGGATPDGGVDLLLRKDRETFLVQCKQWKAYKVGVNVVRELYGVMAASGAAGGFVVTSGTFTAEAVAFAQGRNIKLIDGSQLFGLIRQSMGAAAKQEQVAVKAPPVTVPPATRRAPQASSAPACPKCNSPMVLRTAGKGANAGTRFWGCSTFPACRGTRAGTV